MRPDDRATDREPHGREDLASRRRWIKNYAALIAEERYEPAAFKLSLELKDVRLTWAAAADAGASLPLRDVVRDALVDAVAHGDGDHDLAALAMVALRRSSFKTAAPESSWTGA